MNVRDGTADDEKHMSHALELAAGGGGRVSPNPMVGAVIVSGGRVVGTGRHERAGGPHAEIVAVRNAKGSAAGAALYVNLEPCVHEGRTPPCAPEVVRARFSRVVIGMKDPNPLVNGRGIRFLRARGIEVKTGVLRRECSRLNEVYVKHITTGMPFVILKAACTLDGRIAARAGASKWITSAVSRRDAHALRRDADAVLAGVGTVIADDPRLTCRLPGERAVPFRVILDSRLRIPPGSRVVKLGARDGRTIVFAVRGAPARRAGELERRGCRVVFVSAGADGRVSVPHVLKELYRMGVCSLLVEGGGEVNASFIAAKAVDKVVVYCAPMVVGGARSPGFVGGSGVPALSKAFRLRFEKVERLGPDVRIEAYPETGRSEGRCNFSVKDV
ncbi:MAG: bifunctional diaminohydroxyphosphoribosylaminopyrimidine deaminase/5-amino-6-(5-phosphoribosylamino)uracil reductase RibD [bacterium]